MAKTITKLGVFISSPTDLSEDRKIVSDVIDELNRMKVFNDFELEAIMWETHAFSSIGADAQEVINRQINEGYDIFLGLMWKRFGTATARAESGTEEEFLNAVELHKRNTRPIAVMFFFNN